MLTDGEAYEVTKILKMNVQSGTGTAANYGCPAAGKTGTTDEAKDAWFVGYTPELSAAVWVGYPDAGIAMPGAQGGTYAAPVWHAFMVPAHGDYCDDFPEPDRARAVLAVLREVLVDRLGRHAASTTARARGGTTDDTRAEVRPALLRAGAARRARHAAAARGGRSRTARARERQRERRTATGTATATGRRARLIAAPAG